MSLQVPEPEPARTAPDGAPPHATRSRTPDLIRMANQIAANFAHHRADQAAGEVATHLRTFWSPAMRSDLAAWLASPGPDGDELHPLVVAALRSLQPGA